jgi:hypothetical protein
VSVSQVAPSPMPAASTNVKKEPKNRRTFDPIERLCSARTPH